MSVSFLARIFSFPDERFIFSTVVFSTVFFSLVEAPQEVESGRGSQGEAEK